MNKKYELTDESIRYLGSRLYRIKALRDFGNVDKGDLGGFVESENNLSHEGDCWIHDDGIVMENGLVSDNAEVFDRGTVRNHGKVCGKGKIYGNGSVLDNGIVSDFGRVSGNGRVYDNGKVSGHGEVRGNGSIRDNGSVSGYGDVYGVVRGKGSVSGYGEVYGDVGGKVKICGYTKIKEDAVVRSEKDYLVFKNTWSSDGYFTWTRSNNKWWVGCFYGTGEELIKKAYEDNEESGKKYESYVRFVEENILK